MHSVDLHRCYCAARRNVILSLIYIKILSAEGLLFLIWWQLIVKVVFRFLRAGMAFMLQGEYLKCLEFEALLWVAEVFNEIVRLSITREIGDFYSFCSVPGSGTHPRNGIYPELFYPSLLPLSTPQCV